jgi:hypothetical protein
MQRLPILVVVESCLPRDSLASSIRAIFTTTVFLSMIRAFVDGVHEGVQDDNAHLDGLLLSNESHG